MNRALRYITFAVAVLVTGVLSGIAGGFTSMLLDAVGHLTYGYTHGDMLTAVADASIERRLFGPAIGCALAGLGWWLLRRKATIPNLTEEIRSGRPLGHGPMGTDALLQILAVGSGASLGREQAPRLFAASFTDLFLRLCGSISPDHRRILLASAAGAAFAAVYNVPAAGALFALGLVLGSWRPLEVLVAVATSVIATVTVWPLTHGAPTFQWPDTHVTWEVFLFVIAAMPLAALVGTAFNGLMARAKPKSQPKSWTLILTIGLAGLAIGAISIWRPGLPGNGKSIVLASLAGGDTLPLLVVTLVMLLKPGLTALFIRAGAVGGMIFPALSTGVAVGEFVGVAVNHLGGAVSVPTLALIAGAAVLAITQRAPVFAAVFAVELVHPPLEVWVMLVLAAVGAHVLRRAVTGHRAADRTPAEH